MMRANLIEPRRKAVAGLIVLGLAGAAWASPAHAGAIDTELGVAGPADFTVLGLGSSAGKTATVNLNLATVDGNLGIADTSTFLESNPSTVNGQVIVGSSVNTSGAHGTNTGGIVVNDPLTSAAATAAFAAATYFAGLTPTVSASAFNNGNITGSITVTGTPGLNVVDLSSFNLMGGHLTLQGAAGTEFVLDINGDFNLHTGTISIAGGLTADDVLYNITDPTATVTTMVPTTADGILLAPDNAITSMDSQSFTGEVIGGFDNTIVLMSGTKVISPCTGGNTCGPSTVPEPGSLVMLVTALMPILFLARRRQKHLTLAA